MSQLIQDGLKTVKKILAENYVRPDEAEKSNRSSVNVAVTRSSTVTVTLNEKRDVRSPAIQSWCQRCRDFDQLRQEVRKAPSWWYLVDHYHAVFLKRTKGRHSSSKM